MLNCVPSALKSLNPKVVLWLSILSLDVRGQAIQGRGELAPFQGVITHRYLEYDLVLLNYDILIEFDMVL